MASIGDDFQTRWWDLERKLMEKFGKKPDLESILFLGKDSDGWPHFKQLKNLPVMDLIEQEVFLKDHVLLYFDNNQF